MKLVVDTIAKALVKTVLKVDLFTKWEYGYFVLEESEDDLVMWVTLETCAQNPHCHG